ncbi:MAG TPA: PD-(D/E)XK nuclease family protein [Candidatus Moranbacteria bacterium]|nr:PD-(D/E)XK nuclease family protein [Candidatus Moranbacteria bacterium]HOF42285.1 PD-(D/E)XK nuclease family protein [Candidatus Moranbacteria bacterium]HPX93991.1 PD-(D/E)XK nuclease family protein [Candidatus Moranbacteria bacterium]HQB59282.1 PD-(D/E)XK nuclease family protein [Candidatus Moranbacteria bacterium]
MSVYYKANRTRNVYDPEKAEAFKLSRSKISLFLNCPRCFYLDRRLGIGRPPGFPFNLNSAVDALLKKEFDLHRAKEKAHPLMEKYGIDAVPFQDPRMDEWRDSLRGGIQYLHKETNLLLTGGVDDVWVNPKGELIIVDYKSTSKKEEVNLDADWQIEYKRQMEIYQWLFRKNDFAVSKTGYFVYCNGVTDKEAFDGKLEFDIKIIPYTGDDSWIEGTIFEIKKCLDGEMPEAHPDCDYCNYRQAASKVEK